MSSRDRSPSKTLLAIGTRLREPDESPAQSDLCCRLELNHAMLVSSGERRTAHRLSLVSPPFLSPMEFLVLDAVALTCLFGDPWLIAQTLLEES